MSRPRPVQRMSGHAALHAMWPRALAALAVLLMSACAGVSRPPSASATAPAPGAWSVAAPVDAPGQLHPWWRNFSDPQLDGLVNDALQRNPDLAAAVVRLQRADLQGLLVGNSRLPSWNAAGAAGLARGGGTPGTQHVVSASATVSYEVDLWGRIGLLRDQAAWQRDATEADCHASALMLEGNVASVYWELAYVQRLLANADAGIAYAVRTREIVQARYVAGAVSGGDLAQAEQVLASRRASRAGLAQRRVELRHAMALLLDQPPAAVLPERSDLPVQLIPPVDAGMPADLLAHRPDLRAAELRLRSLLAQRDVARLSFYPGFSLTGTLGGVSEQLASVLAHPAGTLAANLILPFVQGDTPRLAEGIAATQYEEAVQSFRHQLTAALMEVEDHLSARLTLQDEAGHLERAMEQARLAEQHAETRYRAGATAAQLWLDSQQTLRNIEDQLAANRYNQLFNMVRLYQALGGDEDPARRRCARASAPA